MRYLDRENHRSTGSATATSAKRAGKKPARSEEYRGWMIEVYRIGRSEYQAIAEDLTGTAPLCQSPRFEGRGAMTISLHQAKCLVDASIEAIARVPSSEKVQEV